MSESMTYELNTTSRDEWYVYFTAPCGSRHMVATVHEPLSVNPGVMFEGGFGMAGIKIIITMIEDRRKELGIEE
jgi:hypothetical protein